jgi:[CysO sulfur-carrier protein]-S-L-cysteine hydrolase
VLTIGQAIRDAIISHARADHPDEACGMVAGPVGSDLPVRFIPMTNAERSPTFYSFESGEKLRAFREMDDRDEEPVVIYHSHTATEAYPSRTDLAEADFPGTHYVIVSTRDTDGGGEFQFRSFLVTGGVAVEEEIRVVPDAELGVPPTASAAPDAAPDSNSTSEPTPTPEAAG